MHAGLSTPSFHTLDGSIRARSRLDQNGFVLAGSAVMALASTHAPRALWPGAGGGQARPMLLRAHRLLDARGIIAGPAFGRSLVSGSFEAARWLRRPSLPRLALAGFVDVARPTHTDSRVTNGHVHLDAGIGLRLKVPGADGAFHVDYARGVRDGARRFSVSIHPNGWD
jgi:hypothetical protein